jgi:hypothetical protein
MLWLPLTIVLALWLAGYVLEVGGAYVHGLLVAALVLVLVRLVIDFRDEAGEG